MNTYQNSSFNRLYIGDVIILMNHPVINFLNRTVRIIGSVIPIILVINLGRPPEGAGGQDREATAEISYRPVR